MVIALALGLVALGGCYSPGNEYERSTGRYVDDKALASSVENALEDHPIYKLDDVEVTAYRGTVQLSGFVNSQVQKDQAGDTASRVAGVQRVENNISIKPLPLKQDAGNGGQNENGNNAQPATNRTSN